MVVITGAGIVSAIGIGKSANYRALLQGKSGIETPCYLPTCHKEFPVGEVKCSNRELEEQLGLCAATSPCNKEQSETNGKGDYARSELFAMVAIREALAEATLGECKPTMALVSGTTVGGMDRTEAVYPDQLTLEILQHHDCGASTNRIADFFGCFNMSITASTACSSATNALIMAARLIESGKVEMAVAGGTECLTRFHLNGFKSLMILDRKPCGPFDANRNGLNLGEGAGYLVLESETSARARRAKILGILLGYGNACDAYHATASSPDGYGAYQAMALALSKARLIPSDIQYVNAHGTGTPNNDASESAALRRLFSNNMPAISSTKGFTGHTTSASGGIESVFCLMALQQQFIPINLGWRQSDVDCIQPCMSTQPLMPLQHVLCNGFGFGGNDSAIVISHPAMIEKMRQSDENVPSSETSISEIADKKQPYHHVYIVARTENVPTAEYREYINPMKTRRLGRMMKAALVSALKTLRMSETPQPDIIINGTRFGCLEDSEKLLDALVAEGEEASMPTHFMQSTHNTVATQIAISTKNHGYNATYSQGAVSFECALLDAFLQLRSGEARTALVCCNDALTDSLREKFLAVGLPADEYKTGMSLAVMLSVECGNHAIAELQDVSVRHNADGTDVAEISILELNNRGGN